MTEPAHGQAAADSGPTRDELEQLRTRMVRLAVRLVWNRDDAEEIVQEAFQTALQRGVRLDAAGEPWLTRTVAYLGMNRRRRRRPAHLAGLIEPRSSGDLASAMGTVEDLEQLRTEIECLPDQQRFALVLRMMEGMDYGRIADIMQTTESAARTHVHLARRRLAKRTGDSAS